MMSCRCSVTSRSSRLNCAMLGPASALASAARAKAGALASTTRDATIRSAGFRYWDTRFMSTSAKSSVGEKKGAGEDIVRDLWNPAVLAIMQVIRLDHD